MMKYVGIFVLGLFATIVLSCEKESMTFEGPYHVRFTDTLITVKESVAEPIRISIHNAGPVLNEPIKINYSISGNARKGIDYSIEGTEGEVEIPAGESFGFINLNLINNANNILESQELTFTITQVSPSFLAIGRSENGVIGSSFKVVLEDECLLGGEYKSLSPFNGLPDVGKIMVTSDNCIEYTLSNWDIYITDVFPPSKNLTFIDNGDNTITIPEQEEEKLNDQFATMRGTGFINPESGKITLNIEFVDFPDVPVITVEFVPVK